VYFSVSSHRGRINEPGVEYAGEREGNIERGAPPFSERNPPGEGRIVTRGVRHAQQRLLIGAARSGIPSHHGIAPERAASLQRVAFALQVLLAARSGTPFFRA
jgi:hypothetical protein